MSITNAQADELAEQLACLSREEQEIVEERAKLARKKNEQTFLDNAVNDFMESIDEYDGSLTLAEIKSLVIHRFDVLLVA